MYWRKGVFRDIRTAPEVLDLLNGYALKIEGKAGIGYRANHAVITGGRGRGRASVQTATPAAAIDNAKNHTLMKALGGSLGYVTKAGKYRLASQAQIDNWTRNQKKG